VYVWVDGREPVRIAVHIFYPYDLFAKGYSVRLFDATMTKQMKQIDTGQRIFVADILAIRAFKADYR
jgi:hypothetical protein